MYVINISHPNLLLFISYSFELPVTCNLFPPTCLCPKQSSCSLCVSHSVTFMLHLYTFLASLSSSLPPLYPLFLVPFLCPISVFIPQGVLSQSEANLPNYEPHLFFPSHAHWVLLNPLLHTCTHLCSASNTHTLRHPHKSHHTVLLFFTFFFFCCLTYKHTHTQDSQSPISLPSLSHLKKPIMYASSRFLSSPPSHHCTDLERTTSKTRERRRRHQNRGWGQGYY